MQDRIGVEAGTMPVIRKEFIRFKPHKKRIKVSDLQLAGIYLLYREKRIVYIGQSCDVRSRINAHKGKASKKRFDEVRILKCRKNRRLYWESYLIKKYQPEYNKTYRKSNKYDLQNPDFMSYSTSETMKGRELENLRNWIIYRTRDDRGLVSFPEREMFILSELGSLFMKRSSVIKGRKSRHECECIDLLNDKVILTFIFLCKQHVDWDMTETILSYCCDAWDLFKKKRTTYLAERNDQTYKRKKYFCSYGHDVEAYFMVLCMFNLSVLNEGDHRSSARIHFGMSEFDTGKEIRKHLISEERPDAYDRKFLVDKRNRTRTKEVVDRLNSFNELRLHNERIRHAYYVKSQT
tara:strand:- start:3024 stop:4073 length:1050 start_codon:yes stop_codon:yes gene_type:complete